MRVLGIGFLFFWAAAAAAVGQAYSAEEMAELRDPNWSADVGAAEEGADPSLAVNPAVVDALVRTHEAMTPDVEELAPKGLPSELVVPLPEALETVVHVLTGHVSTVEFPQGMVIRHVFAGDPEGLFVEVVAYGDGRSFAIVLRPADEHVRSNLSVVTDEGVIAIQVVPAPAGEAEEGRPFHSLVRLERVPGFGVAVPAVQEAPGGVSGAGSPSVLEVKAPVALDLLTRLLGAERKEYSLEMPWRNALEWTPDEVVSDGIVTLIQLPRASEGFDVPAVFGGGSGEALVALEWEVVEEPDERWLLVFGAPRVMRLQSNEQHLELRRVEG